MMKKPIKLVKSTINNDVINDKDDSDNDKENQSNNNDTISLKPQHKLLSIDIEPYLEEYLADNYFKIHHFKSFQKQGNKNTLFTSSLILYKAGYIVHLIIQRYAIGLIARLLKIR